MAQDLADGSGVGDEGDDSHLLAAAWTGEERLVPEAAVVLVREHQNERENTVSAVVSERLAWRGHATVSARVDGRREATLNFAIGAAVAQRRGIIPGARVPLQLQKSSIRLLAADAAITGQAGTAGKGQST
ncbi:MAG: hypothetical protein V5B34_14480 [Accumulibacter sp.]